MDIEQRFSALEKRLQSAEDELEIIRLLNTYGPLVDSGEADKAARIYKEGGFLDVEGYPRQVAYDGIAAPLKGEAQTKMNAAGCMHVACAPRIKLDGDKAEAVTYNLVILNEGEKFEIWRGAVNHWILRRTEDGWRASERYTRAVNGNEEARELMRKVID